MLQQEEHPLWGHYLYRRLFSGEMPSQVVEAVGVQLERSLAEAVGTPCLGISALTGLHAGEVMPTVLRAYETWNQRVPTARLNRWLVQVRRTSLHARLRLCG